MRKQIGAGRLARTTDRQAPLAVEFTESVMRGILDTVGQRPPETFGILGGSLDQPLVVTDYRFCPPRRDRKGDYERGGGYVNLDEGYMNFVVDEEWKPAGKYILGVVHSHPAGYRSLSRGSEATNEGDIVYFKSCLRHDDSPQRNWKTLIAPIVTFDGNRPDIDVWLVTLDDPEPIRAALNVIRDDFARLPGPGADVETCGLALDAIAERLDQYGNYIKRWNDDAECDPTDRTAAIEVVRRLRERELNDIIGGDHPLGKYRGLR